MCVVCILFLRRCSQHALAETKIMRVNLTGTAETQRNMCAPLYIYIYVIISYLHAVSSSRTYTSATFFFVVQLSASTQYRHFSRR